MSFLNIPLYSPNILIVLATLVGIFRWHFKTRTEILLSGALASGLAATYFYLLNCKMAYTIGVATTLTTILLIPLPNLSLLWKAIIGIGAYGTGIYLYGFSILSLFPITGFTLGRIASTCATPINMKKCYWCSSFMWLSFNLFNGTWAAFLMESMNLISNGVSLFKDWKNISSNKSLEAKKEIQTSISPLEIVKKTM